LYCYEIKFNNNINTFITVLTLFNQLPFSHLLTYLTKFKKLQQHPNANNSCNDIEQMGQMFEEYKNTIPNIFTAQRYASAVYAIVVCLVCVYPSHSGIVPKQLNIHVVSRK